MFKTSQTKTSVTPNGSIKSNQVLKEESEKLLKQKDIEVEINFFF